MSGICPKQSHDIAATSYGGSNFLAHSHRRLIFAPSNPTLRRMKNFVSLLICLSLAWFAIARAVTPSTGSAATAKTMQQKPSGKKADAKTLLSDAKKALAAMIKAARADKGLDPKTAKNKPFWKSTHLVAKNLQTAEKGLTA